MMQLSDPWREVSCNVFVAHRGTDRDFKLLDRFLRSLYASDFPKRSQVVLLGPEYGIDDARLFGAVAAMKGAEWVLMSDTDIVLPKQWWTEMTRVLLAATPKPIGIVGPRINGTPGHEQQNAKFPAPEEPITELGYHDYDFPPYWMKGDPVYLFDGFTLFRSNFLSDTGFYPDAGIQWFVNISKTKYCAVIANRVTIDHNKDV